jgi:DNA-binding protein YbaB
VTASVLAGPFRTHFLVDLHTWLGPTGYPAEIQMMSVRPVGETVSTPFTGNVRDPYEWMREQEQRTNALLARAEEAQTRLAENTVTHSSQDRTVTVTVNPGGGMTALELSPEAERMSHRQLASLILTTYNQAARQAASQTMDIMAGLVGPNSEALDIVRDAMPELPETEDEERLEGFRRAPRTDIDDEEGFQGFNGGGDQR